MFNIYELSIYVVNYSIMNGYPIDNLKLQKLLYYIQKEFVNEGNLAFDEPIVCWNWGPAVEVIYNNFKTHVNSKIGYIENKKFVIHKDGGYFSIMKSDNLVDFEGKDSIDKVKGVIERYKHHSAIEMAKLSMSETDWINTNKNEVIIFN